MKIVFDKDQSHSLLTLEVIRWRARIFKLIRISNVFLLKDVAVASVAAVAEVVSVAAEVVENAGNSKQHRLQPFDLYATFYIQTML